jgi:hypothetical protein
MTILENCDGAVIVPIVDYVLEDIRVRAVGHFLEKVSAGGLAPLRQPTLGDMIVCALRGMRLVEDNPVQMGIRNLAGSLADERGPVVPSTPAAMCDRFKKREGHDGRCHSFSAEYFTQTLFLSRANCFRHRTDARGEAPNGAGSNRGAIVIRQWKRRVVETGAATAVAADEDVGPASILRAAQARITAGIRARARISSPSRRFSQSFQPFMHGCS